MYSCRGGWVREPVAQRSIYFSDVISACTWSPSNSSVFPYCMLLVVVMCRFSGHIHVCSVRYVWHRLTADYWFLCIWYVLYILYLCLYQIAQHISYCTYYISICKYHWGSEGYMGPWIIFFNWVGGSECYLYVGVFKEISDSSYCRSKVNKGYPFLVWFFSCWFMLLFFESQFCS